MRLDDMKAEVLWLIVALMLCLAGVFYVYVTSPTRMTIAVGPAGGSDETLFRTFAAELKAQRRGVRLELVEVPGVREAAEALEQGRVDLAVVRPDTMLPRNGLTVALLRTSALIGLSLPGAKIGGPGDLAGKTLGIVTEQEGDQAVFERLLRHFDLRPPQMTIVSVGRDEAPAALREKRVDMLGLVAEPGSSATGRFVREVAAANGGKLAVQAVDIAEAIASTSLVIGSTTLPAGLWSGRPKLPAEEVSTISVSFRLMARQDVDRSHVAALAENLFQMRSRIALKAPSANLMQPPDTDASSTARVLPNHPGAVDYFQREQQRFIDLYGEWVYILALFGSGAFSAFAALRQRLLRRRRERIDDVLDRLLAILSEARAATTIGELDTLTREVEELLSTAVAYARERTTGSRTTTALVLAIDGARVAVAERRRELVSHQASEERGCDAPPDPAASTHEACQVPAGG